MFLVELLCDYDHTSHCCPRRYSADHANLMQIRLNRVGVNSVNSRHFLGSHQRPVPILIGTKSTRCQIFQMVAWEVRRW